MKNGREVLSEPCQYPWSGGFLGKTFQAEKQRVQRPKYRSLLASLRNTEEATLTGQNDRGKRVGIFQIVTGQGGNRVTISETLNPTRRVTMVV